jgi:hypothetical protein
MRIELSEQATRELVYFVENLNLSMTQAGPMVSAIVLAALTEQYDRWADQFGNAPDDER